MVMARTIGYLGINTMMVLTGDYAIHYGIAPMSGFGIIDTSEISHDTRIDYFDYIGVLSRLMDWWNIFWLRRADIISAKCGEPMCFLGCLMPQKTRILKLRYPASNDNEASGCISYSVSLVEICLGRKPGPPSSNKP